MILRCVFWSVFLCLALVLEGEAQVTVDDQGYQNLMISIGSNVDYFEGEETLEKIQELIRSASGVLHKAIGIPIASVNFLLPPSWSTEKWKNITVSPASPEQTARKVDIRVDATKDSPFGQQPFTLQYGGCGVAGHHITLPLNFVQNHNTKGYPKGKLLAREWLKYRYGVFDENGFFKDLFYPHYYSIAGGSEIIITECTNSKVSYNFTKKNNDDVCIPYYTPFFDDCRLRPDEKSLENVTSSLMYFHKEIPDMEHICGKDGHPHNSQVRNKQNILCSGRSIWDVMKSSDDFKNTHQQSDDPDTKSIKFSYYQEIKPRYVVLLENSDKLFEQQSAIRFALRRFYYDLPPQSKLAIYTYSSDVTEALPYTELPDFNRKDLGTIADFGAPATSICTSCGLARAAQILLEKSEVEEGSVLLITSSPLDKVPVLSEKLKTAGICLNILRFTDENNPMDHTYDAIAKSFYCFSQESLNKSLNVVDIFNNLSRFMKNSAPKFEDEFISKTVASGDMSAEIAVTIPQDKSAVQYTLWLGRALGKDSIECKAGVIPVRLESDTTATDIASFTFDQPYDDVTCRLGSAKQLPVLTQVQMRTDMDFTFETWIQDLSTEKEQGPIIIYVKINYAGYPIKFANVTVVVDSLKNPKEAVAMLDYGCGDPDVTQYDGIYSGFFASFLEAGDYQITVKTDDNEGNAKILKQDPSLGPAPCCGYQVVGKEYDIPAFKMEKLVVYRAKGKRPEDGYPPSRITDLLAVQSDERLFLMWTAPGAGKTARYEIKIFESREDAVTKFDTSGQELNTSSVDPKVPGDSGTPTKLIISLKDYEEGVTNYVAIRSWSEFNKPSEVSNVAEFMNPKPIETTTDKEHETSTDGGTTNHDRPSSGKIVGIVLGVLGGLAVLVALALLGRYYFLKKHRRN